MARRVAAYMEGELKTKVQIDKLNFNFYDLVTLEGFYVEDLHGDTLIYVPELICGIESFSNETRDLILSEVSLNSPVVGLKQYKNEEDLNIQFLVDYFEDPDTTKSKNPWKVRLNRIKLNRADFSFIDQNDKSKVYGIDFEDLHLKHLTVNLANFHENKDTTYFDIDELGFSDRSGFKLNKISAKVHLSDKKLDLEKFCLYTDYSSLVTDRLKFEYNSLEDFNDFEEKVRMTSDIHNSVLHLADLAYFVPELEGMYLPVSLKGKVRGKVSDLRVKNLEMKLSDSLYFKGDIAIEGLPDENALIAVQIDELSANRSELVQIELPPYDGSTFLDLPFNMEYLGQIRAKGNFLGTIYDFVAYAEVKSGIGSLKTDIHFVQDRKTGKINYQGDLHTNAFDMGTYFEDEKLGIITANLNLNATGFDLESLRGTAKGSIKEIGLANYTYHDIIIDGKFAKDFYDGKLILKDPNIDLEYDGYVFFGRDPKYYFTAKIRDAAVGKIHLAELTGLDFFNRDESTLINATVKSEAEGGSLDEFRGKVNIWDLAIFEKGKKYDLQYVKLTARNRKNSDNKFFELASPQFFFNVEGNYTFDNVSSHFINLASTAAPVYVQPKVFKNPVKESFKFEGNITDATLYTELFFPNVKIANGTNFKGNYESEKNQFDFNLYSDYLNYEDYSISKLKINTAYHDSTDFKTKLKVSAIDFTSSANDLKYQNLSFKSTSDGNLFKTDFSWKNNDGQSEGHLVNDILVNTTNRFLLMMAPSYASISGQKWQTVEMSTIVIDSTRINFEREMEFINGKQMVSLKGVIADNDFEKLEFRIEKLRMDNFSYMNSDSTRVDFFGEINGSGFVQNLYHSFVLDNDLRVDSLGVNKELIGNFKVKNTLETVATGDLANPYEKRIHSKGDLVRKNIPALDVDGYFYLEREKDILDYSLTFSGTNLVFLNAFLPSDISNFNALATGKIDVGGTPEKMDLGGSLLFENGAVKVNMLNTSYFFGGKVNIDYDMIYFDQMPIEDVRGNHAVANGTIIHKYFENWNYDFTLDFEKLLCLNTTDEQNNLYFGKAYATGDLEVEGYGDKMNIEVRAKSEKGTKVVLPLYGASEVSLSDFVTFISEDTTKNKVKQVSLEGITMNFDLEITPEAEVKIVFNKTAGDEMIGKGSGNLSMIIDPLGDFNMYGQYTIEDAFYRFTLLDVINKNFTVRKGGTINWYGDPYNADLNLQAVYKVKTSLFDIMPPDIADDYRKATEVNCLMNFKNSLYSPEIKFDIEVPKSDENARSMINSIRSSEQELSKQFFALMVMNKFMPVGGSSNREHTTASAFSTPSELLSSQLSNWLSQISDEFDIGINYRPGTNITGEQVELAFSTQFFDDKVTVSTNVGVSQGNSMNPNNQLIGDFNVEVKLDEDGNKRIRGFNESNQFDIANVSQAPFTQGVGVFYTEEFDKMNETKTWLAIRSIFNKEAREERRRRKDEKKRKKEENKINETLKGLDDDNTEF